MKWLGSLMAQPGFFAACSLALAGMGYHKNPFDLVCECKSSRKIGICAHILAVTHCWVKEGSLDDRRRLSFCNLRLMTQALSSKKGAKWMKGARATKILHYLHKEVDSSDDEADVSFIPRLKW